MTDAGWIVTYRGQASARHCDGMGHVNVRHIEAAFDDATAFMFGKLGVDPRAVAESDVGWADRKHEFDFLSEVLAGDLLEVVSRPTRVGATSVTIRHVMTNALTATRLAEAQIVTVCFDLQRRCARALPQAVAARAQAMVDAASEDAQSAASLVGLR